MWDLVEPELLRMEPLLHTGSDGLSAVTGMLRCHTGEPSKRYGERSQDPKQRRRRTPKEPSALSTEPRRCSKEPKAREHSLQGVGSPTSSVGTQGTTERSNDSAQKCRSSNRCHSSRSIMASKHRALTAKERTKAAHHEECSAHPMHQTIETSIGQRPMK